MYGLWRLLAKAGVGVCLLAVSAFIVSADASPVLVGKAPASQLPILAPAVDGLNGKAELLGGSVAKHTLLGAAGSVSVPLAHQYGLQVDGLASGYRGDFLGAVGVHAFWRDPARGLLGLYGSFAYLDRLGGARLGHFGVEGAIYVGRATLEGVIGVQSGNRVSGTIGGVRETIDVKTRFFDRIDLAYYPTDDIRVSIGHRHTVGKNQLALSGEWGIPMSSGPMTALFVEGRLGPSNLNGVWGGFRVYMGQKPKSLIRRHREDDPGNTLAGEAGAFGGGDGSTQSSSGGGGGGGFVCPPIC